MLYVWSGVLDPLLTIPVDKYRYFSTLNFFSGKIADVITNEMVSGV